MLSDHLMQIDENVKKNTTHYEHTWENKILQMSHYVCNKIFRCEEIWGVKCLLEF